MVKIEDMTPEQMRIELKTIESILFGGVMPEGWNLNGLAGRIRDALKKHNITPKPVGLGTNFSGTCENEVVKVQKA